MSPPCDGFTFFGGFCVRPGDKFVIGPYDLPLFCTSFFLLFFLLSCFAFFFHSTGCYPRRRAVSRTLRKSSFGVLFSYNSNHHATKWGSAKKQQYQRARQSSRKNYRDRQRQSGIFTEKEMGIWPEIFNRPFRWTCVSAEGEEKVQELRESFAAGRDDGSAKSHILPGGPAIHLSR